MTDKEYMDMIIKQWESIDDDPDLFDELNSFEELTSDEEDRSIREGVDPWNLSGRDPTQSVWKDGKRPSPDYYEIINGRVND